MLPVPPSRRWSEPAREPSNRPWSQPTPPSARPTNWIAALALGLLVAILGGLLWGAILAATGYVFVLGALFLGYAVAAALRRGAGRITPVLIVLAVVLTLAGVFVGDVVGLTLAANAEGIPVTIADVLRVYPRIVSIDPGRALIGYFFGAIGSSAGALSLYRQMRGTSVPRTSRRGTVGMPGPVSHPSGFTVMVTARSRTRAAARIFVPGPPAHTVDASYDATFGSAVVALDGERLSKARVWGYKKVVDVPIPGMSDHRLALRFYGATAPRIDVTVDDTLLTTV